MVLLCYSTQCYVIQIMEEASNNDYNVERYFTLISPFWFYFSEHETDEDEEEVRYPDNFDGKKSDKNQYWK